MKKLRPAVYLAAEIDEVVALAGDSKALLKYCGTWVQVTRFAFGFTLNGLATKLGVSRQSVLRLEKRELEGNVSVRKLREVAAAMNCTLVYGFIPAESILATANDLHCRQSEARRRKQRMPLPN
jgi:transcriptional regulator with XRE-family HTH domain